MTPRPYTIETCEGIICRHCRMPADACVCHLQARSISTRERISGQGLVPETEVEGQINNERSGKHHDTQILPGEG
jgi:hypothetical protein